MNSPGMNDKKRKKQSKKLRKEAKKFVRNMAKPYEYNPNFGHLAWFAVFKTTSKEDNENFPADYKYYAQKDFFVEVNLTFGQRIMLKVFMGVFRFLIKIGMI